jgi:hypothetical protein
MVLPYQRARDYRFIEGSPGMADTTKRYTSNDCH